MKRISLDELEGMPCLDLRPAGEYAQGHLPGAVNIPFDELPDRLHELPRRGEGLILFGSRAETAANFLSEKPRWEISYCDDPLPAHGLSHEFATPLWSPNPWLAEHWRAIPAGGRVVDLAMGTGRDAVFLALRGYRVEGEDILPDAVARARDLALRSGVTLDARVGDLRREDPLPDAAYEGILVFNYLDRALLPAIGRALAPGAVLLYETFLAGQEKLGPPRHRDHLLEPGELRASFEELEILDYREGLRAPRRMAASLAARKPERGTG